MRDLPVPPRAGPAGGRACDPRLPPVAATRPGTGRAGEGCCARPRPACLPCRGGGAAEQAYRHATVAAREAFGLRSNREAATQYRRALRFAYRVGVAERATLHEGLAAALALTDHWDESAQEREQALVLRRRLGDRAKISENLRWWSVCLWRLCRGEECLQAGSGSWSAIAPGQLTASFDTVLTDPGSAANP
jgi:hypothetical protein